VACQDRTDEFQRFQGRTKDNMQLQFHDEPLIVNRRMRKEGKTERKLGHKPTQASEFVEEENLKAAQLKSCK
jgi:hypothetical protein